MTALVELFKVWVPPSTPPCSVDPDQWSDVKRRQKHSLTQAWAVSVCEQCPFQIECLIDAMTQEGSSKQSERWGIRGGLFPEERFKMYRVKMLKKKLMKKKRSKR